MKFLFGLLTLFIINKECDSAKTSTANSDGKLAKNEKLTAQDIQDETMTINYSAITRGTRKNILVSKSETVIEDNRSKTPKKTIKTSAEDWNEIKLLISKIDAKAMGNLKAPSTNSHHDGALAASVKLTIDGKEVTTPTFDHGNPPNEIAPLVNKLLSLMENNNK